MTVSELTGLVRAALETDFPDVWLEGEVSNLRAPGSGHLYCTLKDDASQIRAVIFRPTAVRVHFDLEDGLHVVARGKVTVYEPRGECQIVLDHIEPKGRGALQLAFEQLKHRLAADGLFDPDRKRPLPAFPRTVGIVTSPTGAAVRDLVTVLHRRCPILEIIIVPVSVQGDGSAEQIARAIRALNGIGRVDVMIVGRGGGSWEDLWSFNEEIVVRAIAESRIPVVSAVGHETDVTLADFAADMRAPTPSAAAEAVAPVLADVVGRLMELRTRCRQIIGRRCDAERRRLELALSHAARLRFRVQEGAQRVDSAVFEMSRAVHGILARGRERVAQVRQRLLIRSPVFRVRHGMALVPQLLDRLRGIMQRDVERRLQRTHSHLVNLNNLSPLATLGRGYSIVQTFPDRRLVRNASRVSVGQEVLARLAKGQLLCAVKQVLPDSSDSV